jgi:4-amino-4-deoxy-L-arabinose transferase-like glycosyltransferase
MTNEERMSNSQSTNALSSMPSSLGSRHSFVIRVSSLVIRASDHVVSQPFCHVVSLLLLCSLLFFLGLGDRDLLSSHEARAAQDAQMILDDDCWGLPRLFDGHIELQKPPLYYWLVALFGAVLGGQVDAWAVRLPAACAALGCVLFLYFLGRRSGRSPAGFLAGLVLATCLHFTWLARTGRIDMPLTLTVTLAAGGFYLGVHAGISKPGGRAWPWYLLGYVNVALGILLKGPIALMLWGAIIGAFVLWHCAWRRKDEAGPSVTGFMRSLVWGLPLVALIAAPWFVWANGATNNQVWEVFFCYHNFERGLGGSETLAAHPFWFYVPRALIDLLPWSLVLPVSAWYVWRPATSPRDPDPLARFGALWFVAVFGLLSCMSFKRADYLLPAYPGAALFLGCVGERWLISARGASKALSTLTTPRRFAIAVGALVTCYALGWCVYTLWIVPRQEQNWPYYQLARDIRSRTDKPIIFFRAESHVLAFHMGRPLDTILEWENLDVWASQPFPVYFVMPPDAARDWPDHLTKGRLEEVFRTSDQAWGKRERPLVVMRSYQ